MFYFAFYTTHKHESNTNRCHKLDAKLNCITDDAQKLVFIFVNMDENVQQRRFAEYKYARYIFYIVYTNIYHLPE